MPSKKTKELQCYVAAEGPPDSSNNKMEYFNYKHERANP